MSLASSALFRTQVLANHLTGNLSRNSGESRVLTLQPTTFSDSQSRAEVISQEFALREYVVGKDDAAFKALDFLCCQGASKLVSEFLLKYAFEQIQPRGWCCVAENQKGDMVGLVRTYIYQCSVNGEPASVSYTFLMRVHPHYRQKNLATFLITQVFLHDVHEADVDYMTSWVISDNGPSLSLQDKIHKEASAKHGMPAPDVIGSFRCIGISIPNMLSLCSTTNSQSTFSFQNSQYTFAKLSREEQVFYGNKFHSKHQFFPLDLDKLYEQPINVGAYAILEETNGEPEVIALVNVWNNSQVRITYAHDSKFRSEDSVLLHNHWYEDSERGRTLFTRLVEMVASSLDADGFKFAFLFFPTFVPLIETKQFEKKADVNVIWNPRVWYVNKPDKLDMQKFGDIFYDPRECLI